MKKSYLLIFSASVLIGGISMQHSGNSAIEKFAAKNMHKSTTGSPVGKTGAPGETAACTSCHSGAVQSGATENIFTLLDGTTPVTAYTPGNTYSVVVSMNSNPAKRGFQATALDATNTMAGNFTGQTGITSISTGGSRKYANHVVASTSSTVPAWTWTWTAPATDVGNVTFYVATNKTNSSNTDAGDVIYTSQHVIVSSTAGIQEQDEFLTNFEAGYSAATNAVTMEFNSLTAEGMFFNLVDLNGRSVFTYDMGTSQIGANKQKIVLPDNLKSGIYIVNLFLNNKAMTAKIFVQN